MWNKRTKHILLQVHITGKCNLHCKHCYISEHAAEMSYKDFVLILKQYDEFINTLRKTSKEKIVANLHITGGEPFLHSEINRILKYLFWRRHKYQLAFMTNGTVLSTKLIRKLKSLKIKPLQVSLDGVRQTHDAIRAEGNFDKVISALDLLHKHGLNSRVSFTANKSNFQEFPEVAQVCREHHVSSLWSDRFIPCSQNNTIASLNASDMKEYVKILRNEANNPINEGCKIHIQNFRSLQFLGSADTDRPYFCKAGIDFFAIDEFGNILPCRRMPIICGNIHQDTITNVFMNSDVFNDLRKHKCSGKCLECNYLTTCSGGGRCMSYAVLGDYNAPDPCCFL